MRAFALLCPMLLACLSGCGAGRMRNLVTQQAHHDLPCGDEYLTVNATAGDRIDAPSRWEAAGCGRRAEYLCDIDPVSGVQCPRDGEVENDVHAADARR